VSKEARHGQFVTRMEGYELRPLEYDEGLKMGFVWGAQLANNYHAQNGGEPPEDWMELQEVVDETLTILIQAEVEGAKRVEMTIGQKAYCQGAKEGAKKVWEEARARVAREGR
jgi:hypothetical protein